MPHRLSELVGGGDGQRWALGLSYCSQFTEA